MVLKMPFLPFTIMQAVDNFSARLAVALILYVSAIWVIMGLVGVMAGICKNNISARITWILGIVVGVALPVFEHRHIGDLTDTFYKTMVMNVPILIAMLSALGLLLSFRESESSPREKEA